MSIAIDSLEYEKMLEEAIKESPKEACGLLAGNILEDGTKKITKVYILNNIDESKEHFSLDPKEQLMAIKDMRANGMVPLGNWHSHPATPSRPSEEDIRLAYDNDAIYMILSLAEDSPVLNAFYILEGKVTKEILEIIEE